MFQSRQFRSPVFLAAALALAVFAAGGNAWAAKHNETVLYTFTGGSDGNRPWNSLLADDKGNFYGTTANGGDTGGGACQYGCGVVFKLASNGSEVVLHAFTGGGDGGYPAGALIMDKNGNLYGTTSGTGGSNAGTVFKLAPDGTETVLHSFGVNDGAYPYGSLIMDAKGTLYGTAILGGTGGMGTAFKVTIQGKGTSKLSVLHAFSGSDGAQPYAGLIMDSAGNLYGTTYSGGAFNAGTVFKLTPKGKESVLYSFSGGADGNAPYLGALIMDENGNLYGTTSTGGRYGVIFKVTPAGEETVLYTFIGGNDGANPSAGLVRDGKGNFYGTTLEGGSANDGTVFKLTPNGTESLLHIFGGSDGADPYAGLMMDKKGDLYGTTYVGGDGAGTVFKLTN